MIAGVDILPTLLGITGVEHPAGLAGRSFAQLLSGEMQAGRDLVFKEHSENAGGSRDPMRAVQTRRFLYIFNAWSNGERVMSTATTGTQTYRRLRDRAADDPVLAARHEFYQHRVVEELYDVSRDPDCLDNLIAEEQYAAERDRLRSELRTWMEQTHDPLLPAFVHRDDLAKREAVVAAQEEEAAAREPRKRPQRERRSRRP
jgi:N-sulfoglucosamine sulfohydrolase